MWRRLALALAAAGSAASVALALTTALPASSLAQTARTTTGDSAKDPRARVFAKLGDERITVGDLDDAIAERPLFLRERFAKFPDQLHAFISELLDEALLSRYAASKGFDETPEVREQLRHVAVDMLVRDEIDAKVTPASVTEAAERAYYDAHPEEFHIPDTMRAAHILVATKAEATELIAKSGGLDLNGFSALAKDDSLDTETKLRGGDLGYFAKDGSHPFTRKDAPPVNAAIAAAVFARVDATKDPAALRGQTLSEPVPVGGRFSVVRITGYRAGIDRTFEQMRPMLQRRVWQIERQKAFDAYVSKLRVATPIEVHMERADAIHVPDDLSGLSP
ncbi:MAG: peptidyl-prolyl cis-trans isomerase [Myxococcales bacterium]|nr:peptidyl-prolyl cis-trans isomerase [Myxococcales bacterium]